MTGISTQIIFGAGGHASELRDEMQRNGFEDIVFVDDFNHNRIKHGCPVLSFDEAVKKYFSCNWYIAVGDPQARENTVRRLRGRGLKSPAFVSKNAIISPSAMIGDGSQVFSNSIISSDVELGSFVLVNFGCVISHDVKISDYCTISPGAMIAGNVCVGQQAWIGLGAVIRNGTVNAPLSIGEKAVIGASCCVIRDVADSLVVAGVPAKILQPLRNY